MAPNEGEESSKAPRRTSSKYDFVKVKVWIGENSDHYYVLSRFLVSRMLTVTKISNVVAIKIALELKKLLVDNNLLDVSQADLEANLFKLMQKRGYGDEYVNRYKMMTNFHHQRVPLLVLVAGTACVGKSTIATQLAQRLNLPNVLQTDIIYELLRTDPNNAAPLNATPLWARTDVTSTEDLMQEFRRECRVIRKGVDGDLTKTLSDGKPLIMEGLHLDPGIYLTELSQMGMKNPNRLKQVKVHPSEGLKVPQTPVKQEVRESNQLRKGPNLVEQACSAPGLGADESGLSKGLGLSGSGLRIGLGDAKERDGTQSAATEKGFRQVVLTSASGSGRLETRAGQTADRSVTSRQSVTSPRSVTSWRKHRRSGERTQSLADAKEFLKCLAAKNVGERESRAGLKGGVRKSASSCHVAEECGTSCYVAVEGAFSYHVAGEGPTSPLGKEPVMPTASESSRPQESPRGRSDVASAGRSTDGVRTGGAAEKCDQVGVTSLSRTEDNTPTAMGSRKFDTAAAGAGRGQPVPPACVNSLAQLASGESLARRERGGVEGLEGRPSGREPLSTVAERVATDSCTSARNGPSRSEPESWDGRSSNGSGFGRSEPGGVQSDSGDVQSEPGGVQAKPGGVRSDTLEVTSDVSESHPIAAVHTAEPTGQNANANSFEVRPVGVFNRSQTPEPKPNSDPPINRDINLREGNGFDRSGRSGPDVQSGDRSEAVTGNAPSERFDWGAESSLPGPFKPDTETEPSNSAERAGGPRPEAVAGDAPSKGPESGDAKAGPDDAIVVQIVLRMSEEDHSALLDEWLESRRGEVGGDVMLDKPAVLQKLRTIQDYLCSFEDQGVAVVDVSTTSFAQTLDHLHSHLLDCIEGGWSGAER